MLPNAKVSTNLTLRAMRTYRTVARHLRWSPHHEFAIADYQKQKTVRNIVITQKGPRNFALLCGDTSGADVEQIALIGSWV